MVRRLLPFISPDVGVYPIEHLLMEAYMQGMRDTSDAIEHRADRAHAEAAKRTASAGTDVKDDEVRRDD